jgi:hypothetical protein
VRKLLLRRTIIAAGVVGVLSALLTVGILAQAKTPPHNDGDYIKCGGGMIANDSFWIAPRGRGPTEPRDALDTYLQKSPGLRQSARDTSEFRLHQDSKRLEDLSEGDQLRYIHPTDDGFDADVRVVMVQGGWYVESARVCASR